MISSISIETKIGVQKIQYTQVVYFSKIIWGNSDFDEDGIFVNVSEPMSEHEHANKDYLYKLFAISYISIFSEEYGMQPANYVEGDNPIEPISFDTHYYLPNAETGEWEEIGDKRVRTLPVTLSSTIRLVQDRIDSIEEQVVQGANLQPQNRDATLQELENHRQHLFLLKNSVLERNKSKWWAKAEKLPVIGYLFRKYEQHVTSKINSLIDPVLDALDKSKIALEEQKYEKSIHQSIALWWSKKTSHIPVATKVIADQTLKQIAALHPQEAEWLYLYREEGMATTSYMCAVCAKGSDRIDHIKISVSNLAMESPEFALEKDGLTTTFQLPMSKILELIEKLTES